MIKLLIGGSPCTKWSIAQKNGRETEPSGVGWELFLNYAIAKDKFQPDFFLYENNKSAAKPIKDKISEVLGVPLMHINSALVSGQNRERFYAFNWEVPMPEDRYIFLRDILESGVVDKEKSYCLKHQVIVPACLRYERTEEGKKLRKQYEGHEIECGYNEHRVLQPRDDGKTNTLTTVQKDNLIVEPIRIGTIESDTENPDNDSKQYRVYSPDGKSTTLCGNGGGVGAKTGLYAVPVNDTVDGKAKCLRAGDDKVGIRNMVGNMTDRRTCVAEPAEADYSSKNIYCVENGQITIKGVQYPIRLADGHYLIRKLTVKECCRLQTLPDDYCRAVSDSRAYKGLGAGWTAEVIIHILGGALADVPRDEEIVVLSMYDGIGTGRYCLERMGFTNVKYYAYEVDPYAIKVAMSNYPDIIQCGDAFDVREKGWSI